MLTHPALNDASFRRLRLLVNALARLLSPNQASLLAMSYKIWYSSSSVLRRTGAFIFGLSSLEFRIKDGIRRKTNVIGRGVQDSVGCRSAVCLAAFTAAHVARECGGKILNVQSRLEPLTV